MKLALVLGIGVALAASAGCGRAHMGAGYGRSYHDQFAAQADRRGIAKPDARPGHGLDAQEASIIAASYRRSLAPKQEEEKPQPILVVAPQQSGAPRAMPAPSVPKE